MGNRMGLIHQPVIMSDLLVEEKIISNITSELDLKISELKKLVQLDGVEESLVLSLELEQQNLLHIGNLWKFTFLTKLQLANNFIEDIENLGLLSNLKYLDLSFNLIKTINGLNGLVNLTYLNLSSNQITKLENMESLVRLESFLIRYNKIKDFENINYLKQFKNLFCLGIGENPLTSDTDLRLCIIAELSQLKFLDFISITEQNLFDAASKYPIKNNSNDELKDTSSVLLKKYENKEAFVDGLANGRGFDILLENDKNFQLLHTYPPASEIANEHRKKVTEVFDVWYNLGVNYYNQLFMEKEELMKVIYKVHQFTLNIVQEEMDRYVSCRENIPKKLYLIDKKSMSSSRNNEISMLIKECRKELFNANKNLMNSFGLYFDLIQKTCNVFKREVMYIQEKYIKDVENFCSKIMEINETCISDLIEFYSDMFDSESQQNITVVENDQSLELDHTLLQLLQKKEHIEKALKQTLVIHSATLQRRIKVLKSSINNFITDTLNIIHKEDFFEKRNEISREIIAFYNKQNYIIESLGTIII